MSRNLPVPHSSAINISVPRHLQRRLIWLSDAALRNGIHLMGGPGSGKSRLMGRVIAWLLFLRHIPQVILDPIGGSVDNFLDKIVRLPAEPNKIVRLPTEPQERLWQRVTYVDMGATDHIVPWPLYYRTSAVESLFTIANRYLAVVQAMDPYLATASVEGWNALAEIGTYAGMILAALGMQISEAEHLLRFPEQWQRRFEAALTAYPEVRPAVDFFRGYQKWPANLRNRRARSFLVKVLPFTADPAMKALFGAGTPAIDWAQVVAEKRTVLLDFRHELNPERRRFKLLWVFTSLVEFLKQRGVAGREQPLALQIDEVTQLLGFRTLEQSILAEELEELVSVVARNYGVAPLVIGHQSLLQVDERIQNVLMQMGTQIIGMTQNPADAQRLAEQFLRYDPWKVKKQTPVYFATETYRDLLYSYTTPTIIDYTSTEFTPEEQLIRTGEPFRRLGPFHFLARVASGEGDLTAALQPLSIANIDRNQYPDAALIAEARRQLRRRDGIPIQTLLDEIDQRLKGQPAVARKRRKPKSAILATPRDPSAESQTDSDGPDAENHEEEHPANPALPATADDDFWQEVG